MNNWVIHWCRGMQRRVDFNSIFKIWQWHRQTLTNTHCMNCEVNAPRQIIAGKCRWKFMKFYEIEWFRRNPHIMREVNACIWTQWTRMPVMCAGEHYPREFTTFQIDNNNLSIESKIEKKKFKSKSPHVNGLKEKKIQTIFIVRIIIIIMYFEEGAIADERKTTVSSNEKWSISFMIFGSVGLFFYNSSNRHNRRNK